MEDPSTNDGAMEALFSNRFLASTQNGLSSSGVSQEKYTTHGQQTNLSAVMSVPKFEPNTPQTTRFVEEDPYLDDDLLQDDIGGSYQYHLPKPMGSESSRQPYDQGSYVNLLRQNTDASGTMEGAGYHAFSTRSSVDYSSYPESHSVPRALNGSVPGYNNGFQEEVDDDGLFIETMPAIANDRYVKRKYGSPMGSLGGSLGDSLGDSILSPHRSPRPLEPSQRRSPLYNDDDHYPAQPYPSISVFRDGGIGVGRSYRHNSLATHGEEPKWNRAYSLSRNLDELGGQYPMRSSSYSRIPKEYSDGYGSYSMGDRIPPHRVNSMERIPTELGAPRGYAPRVLPHNHSFIDSMGFIDRDDLPMSRARSMLYLGEDDDTDLPLPHRNSKADLALLAQSALGPAEDMTSLLSEEGSVKTNGALKGMTGSRTPPTNPSIASGASIASIASIASTGSTASSTSGVNGNGTPAVPRAKEAKNAGLEWRRSNSPLPHGSKTSPRPVREDEDHEKKHAKYRFPCRDFEKGVCSRGAACKFYHDPAKGRRWGWG